MNDLREHQKQHKLEDEPACCDPSDHPTVPHKNGKPVDVTKRTFHEIVSHIEPPCLPEEERKQHQESIAACQEWDQKESNFVRRHFPCARGQAMITPDEHPEHHKAQACVAQSEEEQPEPTEQAVPAEPEASTAPEPKNVPLDLTHRRLGHRHAKTVLLASENNLLTSK